MKPKRKSGKSFSKASAKVSSKVPERTNPFEVKVNKQRHDVLGRKSKNDRGLPGVSRSKAIKKRNETLLQEYVLRNKSSAFVDKRIGEFDSEMNPDDKMAARLAQERKISQKKSVFSLNEEEELTHLGKSINDMERHDDPRSDDEDLYDKLGRDFADKTNFGGFLTKADPSSDSANSRLKKKPTEAGKESTDDYDVLVKQLRFAPRAGTATERVKTADEVAKEERKQLEKLEEERKQRAKGIAERDSKKQRYFMSADDLDDGFYKQEPVTEDADMSGDEKEEEDAEEEGSGSDDEAEDKSASEGDDEGGAESVEEIEQDSKAAAEKEGGKPISKAITEKKESRLTCIVTIPESEEEFSKLVADKTADEKARLVGDMIKANQGGEKKLKKLEMLFVFLLQHLNDIADEDIELKLKLRLLGEEDVEMTDQLRVEIIYAGVKLVEKCTELSEGLPSFRELVDPLLKTLRKLEVSAYPPTVQSEVEKVITRLDRKVERKPLRPEKRPPPMKQLLEPRFNMKFDGRKHFEGGQKKAELKRLTYKHKKEMKGAMREVRRDNQFLARHILKDRIERDAERKEKVKQIYRELASQEGEYKALKRKKK
ncbi:hypothetical protein HPB47_024593 [Ixodes persulcatus]|uniref:Uncharacterized protein n=1 Tax=Ixodes persulcatus TaxID=34615 RepID=A0AC60Q537_IXOPE|nr:hypothetical protein HPB47_024593 [Ixodes persulcatus]